ncbi:transcriptional regulator [Bacillus methanolicus]|nr:helix-turn-helix transcriptional regulator [Bacillus methanolicus]MDE3837896.1 transcriptional regulator [Bacillus methanolicus]
MARTWLKEFRIAKGFTQYDVAKRVGIERSYYTMIESGNRTPSVSVAQSIGGVLDFDWTIFFTQNSNETLQKTSSA